MFNDFISGENNINIYSNSYKRCMCVSVYHTISANHHRTPLFTEEPWSYGDPLIAKL